MIALATFAFCLGIVIGGFIASHYAWKDGYKKGASEKRASLVAGMDALLESEDLKIYVKKGSSFLTDGPR